MIKNNKPDTSLKKTGKSVDNDVVLLTADQVDDEAEEKLPIMLQNKVRLERLLPMVKHQENQIQEFWGVLNKLKKECKETVTKEELQRKLTDCREETGNKVSYDMAVQLEELRKQLSSKVDRLEVQKMVERKAENSVVKQIESQLNEFNNFVRHTIYIKLCDQLERLKMILATKVSTQQLEECILQATGQPVTIDANHSDDDVQANKLELLNEKVQKMSLEIEQHTLKAQIMTKNLETTEQKLLEKIEESNLDLQVVQEQTDQKIKEQKEVHEQEIKANEQQIKASEQKIAELKVFFQIQMDVFQLQLDQKEKPQSPPSSQNSIPQVVQVVEKQIDIDELLSTNKDYLSLKNQVNLLPYEISRLEEFFGGLKKQMQLVTEAIGVPNSESEKPPGQGLLPELQKKLQDHIASQNSSVISLRNEMKAELKEVKAELSKKTKKPSTPVSDDKAPASPVQEFNIQPFLQQIRKEMEQIEQRLSKKIKEQPDGGDLIQTGGGGAGVDLRTIVARLQAEMKLKFETLVRLDAQMHLYQLEHDLLKKKRFDFELTHSNQINAIKQNQAALDNSMQETKKFVLNRLQDHKNSIDPKTEKAINDLRKISFNHIAPLIDNMHNLSKENEQLLHEIEIHRQEVGQLKGYNYSLAETQTQGGAQSMMEAPASKRNSIETVVRQNKVTNKMAVFVPHLKLQDQFDVQVADRFAERERLQNYIVSPLTLIDQSESKKIRTTIDQSQDQKSNRTPAINNRAKIADIRNQNTIMSNENSIFNSITNTSPTDQKLYKRPKTQDNHFQGNFSSDKDKVRQHIQKLLIEKERYTPQPNVAVVRPRTNQMSPKPLVLKQYPHLFLLD